MKTTIKNSNYLIKLTMIATLGGVLFGYDTAVISGTVGSLENFFIIPFGLDEIGANSLLGLVVSSALIGCVIGGLSGGIIAKKLGRKKGLILAALLFVVSALGSSMPEMFIMPIGDGDHNLLNIFIMYRIIGGIGVGLASMLSPLYIAEIAPAQIRGRLVSKNQFAIVFGLLAVYFVNYFIARNGDDNWLNIVGWRWMFASEIIPAGLFLLMLFFVPDTPRSLMLKNKDKEALFVLTKINGEEKGKTVLSDIKESMKSENGKLFSYGPKIIIIGILLSVFQQFVGINGVLYYAPEIFKSMGSGTYTSLLQTIAVGAILLVFTVLTIVTIEKFGRKPLMIYGALGMSISMFALGTTFYFEITGVLALILMLVYVACFGFSWGPVVWVLLSEIFPNKIRGKVMAIAVASQWISNYLVSWTFPMMDKNTYLLDKFHHGFAYWIYGLMSLLAMYFVWKYVPETKGKTLEEMEGIWQQDKINNG